MRVSEITTVVKYSDALLGSIARFDSLIEKLPAPTEEQSKVIDFMRNLPAGVAAAGLPVRKCGAFF